MPFWMKILLRVLECSLSTPSRLMMMVKQKILVTEMMKLKMILKIFIFIFISLFEAFGPSSAIKICFLALQDFWPVNNVKANLNFNNVNL